MADIRERLSGDGSSAIVKRVENFRFEVDSDSVIHIDISEIYNGFVVKLDNFVVAHVTKEEVIKTVIDYLNDRIEEPQPEAEEIPPHEAQAK